MAHYAFLDENNVVTGVIVGVDETELIEGKTPEQWYGEFKGQKCKRTSYNTFANQHLTGGTPFRGNYAGIGYTYDERFDVFIAPKPYDSWKLNYTTYLWEAPTPMPSGSSNWAWSEHNKEWISVSFIK
jgi:hypothetical protein